MIVLLLVAGALAFPFGKKAPAAAPAPPVTEAPPPSAGWVSAPGSLFDPTAATSLTGMSGRAKQAGDLVTVIIDENLQSQVDAMTKTSAAGSVGFGVDAAFGLETQILNANPSMGEGISLGLTRDTSHDGKGAVSRNGTIAGTITCKVMAVLTSGNLILRGQKEIVVNGERQYLTLVGEAQGRDISSANTIYSWRLADPQIEITGKGVVGDKQRVGWGQRLLDHVSP